MARLELDTPERRDLADRIASSTRDPFEAWDRLRMHRAREGYEDDPLRLFHLRGVGHGGAPGSIRRRMRACAVTIALCRSPGVPPARAVHHPITTQDAVAFSRFAPLVAQAERLALAATRALDALGRSTRALSCDRRESIRRPVWRTGIHRERPPERAALLLAVELMRQAPGGLADVPIPRTWWGAWTRACVAAVGELAWRKLVAQGSRVEPQPRSVGARFYLDPAAVGRAFADLESPFGLLLQLESLGVEVVGFSHESVTLELWP
ncbi:hypothetical protein [Polyangium mundeleinium]|uniref:Uncharacterized protein n=1 Tax=Polyangium mundeleinium TaxID=2995306 RepID=A0ABT5EME6_9BACT|nr:hypothetical protein [Polyangium mundeleinium]MDC0743018.1 hypothetical protein [Polyangium mundeleinium]